MYLAKVHITLKPTVSDPEGQTIKGGLETLGFEGIESVRAGKYLQIRLDGESESAAAGAVGEMCDKLLANPVIEDYAIELIPLPLEHDRH